MERRELIGTVKYNENYDRCSGYDNPIIRLISDSGEVLVEEEEYIESHYLFNGFDGKRVRIVIEEVGE